MNAPLNVATTSAPARSEQLARMQEMVGLLEAGEDTAFEARFASFLQARDQGLFVSVAKLTRGLHDAVRELRFDDHLSNLAGREIPDACSRLDYVVKVSEEAAHKTLDLVEQAKSLTQDIGVATQALAEACKRAQDNAGSSYAVSGLVLSVDQAREHIAISAGGLRERLSSLAQAQEYQDLSGQVIKRVTNLVRSVEGALIDLLRASGSGVSTRATAETPANGLHGPVVAGVTPSAVSQDDADSLLAELGF